MLKQPSGIENQIKNEEQQQHAYPDEELIR